jgi:LPS export ABC transporter protein LptC
MRKSFGVGYHRQNIPVIVLTSFVAAIAVFIFFNKKNTEKNTVERAEIISSSSDQELQKFSLSGFDEKGKKFWNLEGDAAKIDPSQTVFLEENVTLKLRDDTVIKTDQLQWSQDRGILKTNAFVRVDHSNAKVTGTGAFGRPNEGFVQLNRKIEMIIDSTTTVTCDGPMKIYYNDDKMVFYRNVKVVDQRGVLRAKRMDVFFDSDKKQVDRIVAIGDVKIERGTDTTHSKRAIYSLLTGSVRLEGSPEITLHKSSESLLHATARN